MSNNKPRVGVIENHRTGETTLVWISPDGDRTARWLPIEGGGAKWYDFASPESTLTPYEDWTPPVEDGVWWCTCTFGGCASWLVKDGTVYSGAGNPVGSSWTPVERLGNLPTGWEPLR